MLLGPDTFQLLRVQTDGDYPILTTGSWSSTTAEIVAYPNPATDFLLLRSLTAGVAYRIQNTGGKVAQQFNRYPAGRAAATGKPAGGHLFFCGAPIESGCHLRSDKEPFYSRKTKKLRF